MESIKKKPIEKKSVAIINGHHQHQKKTKNKK